MTLPTHLLLGLVIGKATGEYPAAIVGSLVVDIDHVGSYTRRGILGKPLQLLSAMCSWRSTHDDERGFLHTLLAWAAASAVAIAMDAAIGSIFALSYGAHLLLDVLDDDVILPLRPFSRRKVRGPVPYASRWEGVVASALLAVLLLV